MNSDLSQSGSTSAEASVRPSNPEPAPSSRGRNRVRLFGMVVIILLVLLGAAGGSWWWRSLPARGPKPPVPEKMDDPEFERAVEEARRKVQDKPRSADSWSDLGLLLLAHHCNPEADFCFAEACRLEPDNARWYYYRYVAAVRIDPEHMLPFLRQAEQHADSLPDEYRSAVRLRLAEVLLENGENAAARSVFDAEHREHPNSERAALGLGLVALTEGDNATARRYLVPLARNSVQARKKATLQLALLSRRQRDASAAAAYEQSLASLPADQDWPDPFYVTIRNSEVGDIKEKRQIAEFEKHGYYREAANVSLARLERQPTAANYLSAGVDLVRCGDTERGLSLLREAERLDPNNPTTAFRIAETLFDQASKSPESANAGPCLREAATAAGRATRLKPDYAIAYQLQGEALLRLGEPTAALEPLRRGVACRPQEFKLHYFLGRALLESAVWYHPAAYLEAARQFHDARKIDPKNPLIDKALEQLPLKKAN